jgi:hypothetical protein
MQTSSLLNCIHVFLKIQNRFETSYRIILKQQSVSKKSRHILQLLTLSSELKSNLQEHMKQQQKTGSILMMIMYSM